MFKVAVALTPPDRNNNKLVALRTSAR